MGRSKVINVSEDLIPVKLEPINVNPTVKEVSIPKGTVAWRSGDTQGFINRQAIPDIEAYHKKHGLPFEYDESKTTIPKPIGYKQPFGKGKDCATC